MRFSKASEEQIPTAICEETTKRVNCHENGNLPLFYIEKDTRNGVLYAPFACVLMAESMLSNSNFKVYIGDRWIRVIIHFYH